MAYAGAVNHKFKEKLDNSAQSEVAITQDLFDDDEKQTLCKAVLVGRPYVRMPSPCTRYWARSFPRYIQYNTSCKCGSRFVRLIGSSPAGLLFP